MGDGNWSFSAGCYHAALIFHSFIIRDNEKLLLPHFVTQKHFTSFFFFRPSFFNESWRYFKQGPACFVSAILFQRIFVANNAERGDNNAFGFK